MENATLGVNIPYDEVICYRCENVQFEPHFKEKYAWECRKCKLVNEGDKPHLLTETARFDRHLRFGMGM